jgi:hypothetical protein
VIEYLNNPAVSGALKAAPAYRKSALTGLRAPSPDEIGAPFPTFVKDGDGVRQESSNVVTPDVVVARNPSPIGRGPDGREIYNEWLVPRPTAIKNYGKDAIDSLDTNAFTSHRKTGTIRAIELTPNVMKALGVEGDELAIKVSWSSDPMIAKVGDFLTDGGYSVSKHDMSSTYEPVPANTLQVGAQLTSFLMKDQAPEKKNTLKL